MQNPSPAIFGAELCSALKDGKTALASDVLATTPRQHALLDLVRAVADGLLPADKLCAALKMLGIPGDGDPKDQEDEIMLADALWFVWLEAEGIEERRARLAELGKQALRDRILSKQVLLEISEGDFMEEAGLVVSYRDGWRRKEIRCNTRAVYTQRKFNMLREESEGWAKVATLLNQAGSGALAADRVQSALVELKSLVGYFDLDPNRACSVWLDAFAAQPNNIYYLRLAPAFSADALTQLLGFHFQREGPVPSGLYTISARLIGAGLVTLDALLAHFTPKDADVKESWAQGVKHLHESVKRIGVISLASGATPTAVELVQPGAASARPTTPQSAGVSAAGAEPLPSRSGPTTAALELDPKRYVACIAGDDAADGNQRIRLLAQLLRVGASDPAQRLFKWMAALGISEPAVFPPVGKALCELLAAELMVPYESLCPGRLRDFAAESSPSSDFRSASHAAVLPNKALELLRLIGVHLYHDIATLTRLIRVLRTVLDAHPIHSAEHDAAVGLISSHVLPAQALIPANPALVLEVWGVLSRLTYTQRFALYADLQGAATGSSVTSALLAASAKLSETEVRRILRRVTAPANRREAKLTMRPLGRKLAKIAHANPLAVSEQLLRQVMGMPGMVASISEALRYLTPLAFDVLTFAAMKQLAAPRRKLKEDGVNLEEWFQWLSAFVGQLCVKNEEVELTAVLQYVVNQLKMGESLDLLVLQEIIAAMAGVAPVFEVSRDQLEALAGSEALRSHVFAQQVEASGFSERVAQRNIQRLLDALQTGPPEHQLALPLLILLAQQRRLITLQPPSSHLKSVTELYDKCQEALAAYSQFLRKALPLSDYASLLPSLGDLISEYAVEPEVAFEMYRPLIKAINPRSTEAMDAGDAANGVCEDEEEGEEGEIAELKAATNAELTDKPKSISADLMDVEDGEVPEESQGQPKPFAAALDQGRVASSASLQQQVIQASSMDWDTLLGQTKSMMPEGGFRGMSLTLFLTFWAMDIGDLHVPRQAYQKTIAEARSRSRSAREDLEAAKRDLQRGFGGYGGQFGYGGQMQGPPSQPPATVDAEGLSREAERMETLETRLQADIKEQEAMYQAADARLKASKESWVVERIADVEAAAVKEFVQYCLLPRVLASPADALFCARFLSRSQPLAPPGFRLLPVLDRVFREMGFLVRCATPREAAHLGIFFADTLALVARWRDRSIYARECAGTEGFRTYAAGTLSDVPFEKFLHLSANWQKSLTLEVFGTCLASADYMQMRNALLALNRMVHIYPATREDAQELLTALEPVAKEDPREDLKTLARMYCSALKAQMMRETGMVATRDEYAGKRRAAKTPQGKASAGLPKSRPTPKDAVAVAKGEEADNQARASRSLARADDKEKKEKESMPDQEDSRRKDEIKGKEPERQRQQRDEQQRKDQSRVEQRGGSPGTSRRPTGGDGGGDGGRAPPGSNRAENRSSEARRLLPRKEDSQRHNGGRGGTRGLRADAPSFIPDKMKTSARGRAAEEAPAEDQDHRVKRRRGSEIRTSDDAPRRPPDSGPPSRGGGGGGNSRDRRSGGSLLLQEERAQRDSFKRKREEEAGVQARARGTRDRSTRSQTDEQQRSQGPPPRSQEGERRGGEHQRPGSGQPSDKERRDERRTSKHPEGDDQQQHRDREFRKHAAQETENQRQATVKQREEASNERVSSPQTQARRGDASDPDNGVAEDDPRRKRPRKSGKDRHKEKDKDKERSKNRDKDREKEKEKEKHGGASSGRERSKHRERSKRDGQEGVGTERRGTGDEGFDVQEVPASLRDRMGLGGGSSQGVSRNGGERASPGNVTRRQEKGRSERRHRR